MEIRLDGKSAVITGGSKGLGLAMAQRFAASGADVAILARSPDTLAEAKAKIQAGAKGKVATVSADVSKAADIRRAYDTVMSELGKIDILVNNAGQATRGPSVELTDEMWQSDLDLKLFAQIRLARLVFPQMKERIINVLNIGAKGFRRRFLRDRLRDQRRRRPLPGGVGPFRAGAVSLRGAERRSNPDRTSLGRHEIASLCSQ